jgi:hypothetical protein
MIVAEERRGEDGKNLLEPKGQEQRGGIYGG